MKLQKGALTVANRILDSFKAGTVAKPLATVYINRDLDRPMNRWSARNQLGCYLAGDTDARGFRQWQQVGRHVVKGNHCHSWIVNPLVTKKAKAQASDPDETYVRGFRTTPVYDVSQTDGEPMPDQEENRARLDAFPLVDVARAWGIEVATYDGLPGLIRGSYNQRVREGVVIGQKITIGVENPNTFLHELMHAADARAGGLPLVNQEGPAKVLTEAVAQLGASVLAHLVNLPDIADEGKTWAYISSYAKEVKLDPHAVCAKAISRLDAAIQQITEEANNA